MCSASREDGKREQWEADKSPASPNDVNGTNGTPASSSENTQAEAMVSEGETRTEESAQGSARRDHNGTQEETGCKDYRVTRGSSSGEPETDSLPPHWKEDPLTEFWSWTMSQQQRCEDSGETHTTATGIVNTDLSLKLEEVEEVTTMEEARQKRSVKSKEVTLIEKAEQARETLLTPALEDSSEGRERAFISVVNPDAQGESSSEGPTILIASAGAENRHFVSLDFLGRSYKALFDPGAMTSLIGPTLADLFSDRLRPCNAFVRGVTGSLARVSGILQVSLDVEGVVGILPMRAVPTLDYDAIVGVDFCTRWGIEVRFGEGSWRVPGGEWRFFENESSLEDPAIIAECAGVSELTDGERALGIKALTPNSSILILEKSVLFYFCFLFSFYRSFLSLFFFLLVLFSLPFSILFFFGLFYIFCSCFSFLSFPSISPSYSKIFFGKLEREAERKGVG